MLATVLVILGGLAPAADPGETPLKGVRRVVFLGDSITYAGRYVEFVEAYLRARYPDFRVEFLDLGLPSETVSGLSEPGHAGGEFPRPVLRERLGRVLAQTKPDLIVACYGMNDGIYHPFAEGRLETFRAGLRELRAKAEAAGAKVVHLTPPVFDPLPIKADTLPQGLAEYRKPYFGYDEVLERYSDWLLARRRDGWDVVDVHGPMRALLDRRREKNPAFALAKDGVHADDAGHWLIARQLLMFWGVPAVDLPEAETGAAVISRLPHGADVMKLVSERQRLLKDAWLTATGHARPGMKPGWPLDKAERTAADLETQVRNLTMKTP